MTGPPEAPETLFFDQYDTQVGVVGVLAGPAGVRRTGWRLSARGASIEPDETVQIAIGQGLAAMIEPMARAGMPAPLRRASSP